MNQGLKMTDEEFAKGVDAFYENIGNMAYSDNLKTNSVGQPLVSRYDQDKKDLKEKNLNNIEVVETLSTIEIV